MNPNLFQHIRYISIICLLCSLMCALPAAAETPFNRLWSGFSTSLEGRSTQQRHNASLAGRFIDGFIIPPGGIFSFNEQVGGRSRAKGYKTAPFLNADGLLEDAPGGGICQLASTIYNAGLLGGLEVVERHPHSRTVLHVPPGRDATIASWRKDLKLRNPFPHPLLLRISSDNNRLNVALHSPVDKNFEVQISTEQLALEAQAVAGRVKQSQQGGQGYATVTWRSIRRDGTDRKELLSEDLYPPPSRIIAGGGE